MPRLGALACFALATSVSAFAPLQLQQQRVRAFTGLSMGYVPDGLTPEQWREVQQREKDKTAGKNLGAVGVTKFQSRSYKAWQESGAKHLFPVDLSKTPLEERPYMMRKNGKWDNSDLKEGKGEAKVVKPSKKVDWTPSDKAYANGGEKRAQSVSIFGEESERLNWTGK